MVMKGKSGRGGAGWNDSGGRGNDSGDNIAKAIKVVLMVYGF